MNIHERMKDDIKQAVDAGWEAQIRLLQELVRIPSLTGEERAAQERVALAMIDGGLTVDVWCPTHEDVASHPAFCDDGLPLGDRPVLAGRWESSGDGRSLILNGHMDVVPVGEPSLWRFDPWAAVVEDGRLHGRGSCDMKTGVVAALSAVAALKRMGHALRGDVIIQSVIGEESGGVGTLAAITRGYRADAAIIMEPTQLALSPVGSGALSFRLAVSGKAAHGGLREEGVSAVEPFIPLFRALQRLEAERHAGFSHPLFSQDRLAAPLSIGIVRAGDWVSTVPAELTAEGRYGVFPGESLNSARRQLEEAVATAASSDAWLSAHPPAVEWFEGQFEPGETPDDAPIVRTLAAAHQAVTARPAAVMGVPYGSDLRLFTNHASMPCVLYGAGDVRLAHTVQEYVPLDEVRTLTEALALTIADWCG